MTKLKRGRMQMAVKMAHKVASCVKCHFKKVHGTVDIVPACMRGKKVCVLVPAHLYSYTKF